MTGCEAPIPKPPLTDGRKRPIAACLSMCFRKAELRLLKRAHLKPGLSASNTPLLIPLLAATLLNDASF
jgi:hypothetical protein